MPKVPPLNRLHDNFTFLLLAAIPKVLKRQGLRGSKHPFQVFFQYRNDSSQGALAANLEEIIASDTFNVSFSISLHPIGNPLPTPPPTKSNSIQETLLCIRAHPQFG
jgi:hypothetical protein